MMNGIDTIASFAIMSFVTVGLVLMLFMVLVQPVWCLIDCAVDRRRSTGGKVFWILVLVVFYGVANWFYGAFAATGPWLRRLSRLAWVFGVLFVIGFVAMYNMHESFRRGIDKEWQRGRELVVMVPASATIRASI